jgi:hypothetical protein
MLRTSTFVWNSPYFNFFCHSITNARMNSANALIRQIFLVLLEYCSFSKVVLQYQYQGFSIVLQYKTARLVHPWPAPLLLYGLCGPFRKMGTSSMAPNFNSGFLSSLCLSVDLLSLFMCAHPRAGARTFTETENSTLTFTKQFFVADIWWLLLKMLYLYKKSTLSRKAIYLGFLKNKDICLILSCQMAQLIELSPAEKEAGRNTEWEPQYTIGGGGERWLLIRVLFQSFCV